MATISITLTIPDGELTADLADFCAATSYDNSMTQQQWVAKIVKQNIKQVVASYRRTQAMATAQAAVIAPIVN